MNYMEIKMSEYLDYLKDLVKTNSKEFISNELGISLSHLNNILSGKRDLTIPVTNKIDNIINDIFYIPKEYKNLISLFNHLYDNADIIEDSPKLIEKIKGIVK